MPKSDDFSQVDYGKDPRFSEQWDRLQREFTCCGVTGPRDFEPNWPATCCGPSLNASDPCPQPHQRGCEETLVRWLRKTADLLFVLGFCVIAFAKLCFLGILRYEIREMIQKIRLLREPPPPATPFAQPPFSQMLPEMANNGSITRRTTLPNAMTPSGTFQFYIIPACENIFESDVDQSNQLIPKFGDALSSSVINVIKKLLHQESSDFELRIT